MSISLSSLPEEIIFKIFELCDLQCVGRLARTCKKFKYMLDDDIFWLIKSRRVLGSNLVSTHMQRRSKPNLNVKKRCEVSKYWKEGKYRKNFFLKYQRCMPWLYLEQNYLICSFGRVIGCYLRDDNGYPKLDNIYQVVAHSDDVAKFVINENEVVSGGKDGTISRWKKTNLHHICSTHSHIREIHSIDAKNDIILSGSKDCSIKIWKALPRTTVLQKSINMGIRVLSLSVTPSNNYFIAGLPGTNNIHPLQLFDLERAQHISNFGESYKKGAGILDIYPEFENTFLSCGYDTTVQLWDKRCPARSVAKWMDPYDNSIYCVRSDHNVTIVSGANRNGLIHIWDKRLHKCQFMHYIKEYNSPVYSVAFDASHLYAAFDTAALQCSYLFLQKSVLNVELDIYTMPASLCGIVKKFVE